MSSANVLNVNTVYLCKQAKFKVQVQVWVKKFLFSLFPSRAFIIDIDGMTIVAPRLIKIKSKQLLKILANNLIIIYTQRAIQNFRLKL